MTKSSVLIFFALLAFGCGANQSIMNSGQKDPAASPTPFVSDFEQELKGMQTADFDFIYVFRRKDGGVFDKADKDFVRANKPPDTNRFVLTDADRTLLVGSNYPFPPEKLKPLKDRFSFEDFSKTPNTAGNSNVNANTN